MKKLVVGLLLLTTITAQAAAEYACKDIYEHKIARMKKNKNLREAGRVAGAVVVGATVLVAATATAPAVGIAIIGGLPFAVGFAGFPTYVLLHLFDREQGILEAYSAQSYMHLSHADLMEILEANRKEFADAALKAFDIEMTYPDMREALINRVNEQRRLQGLPYQPGIVVIANARQKIKEEIMTKPIEVSNGITQSLALAKRIDSRYSDYSYDQWRETLLVEQDLFCVKGKARTLRRVTKDIVRQ